MKKVIMLCTPLFLLCFSLNAWSFSCKSATGGPIVIGGGSASVFVNMMPTISPGQNLVVDLSTQISCVNNSAGGFMTDFVSLDKGTSYGGVLANFTGTVRYNGTSYPLPVTSETAAKRFNDTNYVPWPTSLYLTPVSTASGVVVNAGTLIARIVLHQTNDKNNDSFYFTWNIYAKNNVVIPTGGCDVSARDVTVKLPDYPGSAAIPLNVHCAKNQNLGYYLSGTTADSTNTIFTNTASTSAAKGIGVQLSRNGNIIPTNKTVSLGTVGTSPVNLGLTASYAKTSGQVTAGNVQSIIGVTFVYQ